MSIRIDLELITTTYTLEQLQEMPLSQVAMAGRSNVGKSSLINMLGGRRKMAKISSKPGKTRSLNFYQVRPMDFYLVDLPGYGYAKCSKKEREHWARLVDHYFRNNSHIKGVVLLIDCRIPPQDLDLELATFVRSKNIPLLPVLTKADKCNVKQRSQSQRSWEALLDNSGPPILVSSKTGMNRDKLLQKIIDLAINRT